MLLWLMEGYIGLFLLAEIVFLFIVTTVVIDGWSLPNSNRLQEKSFSAYSVAKEVCVLYPGSLWWQDYRRIFYYCVARLYHCGDIGCACCVSNRIVNEITAIEHEGFDPLYTTL